MDGDVFVPFVFFGFLAAIILVPIWLKERTKQSAHNLISQALEKGQPLDANLMRELTNASANQAPPDKARRSLGSGVVLLALAGGFVAAGFAVDGFDPSGSALRGMMVPAAILGALGVGFILLALVDFSAKKKDQ
jgi:hypothetical protein